MEQGRTHPILIAAGVAVLLFSLLGAAALTGILPSANTKPGDPAAVAQRDPTTPPRTAAPVRPAPQRGIFSAP